ncbi:hypothetical protein F5Y13DRAFT_190999 [Hypoxylon sp. FL1857]|nr:hypothetical protein F5Y13DRAFT_190999 [Hypoxylon sp. FL1857]
MPRMPKLYSPYGPRPKRSAQLVLIWMVIMVFALVATFYLTTREHGIMSLKDTRLVDEIDKIKEQAEGNGDERQDVLQKLEVRHSEVAGLRVPEQQVDNGV